MKKILMITAFAAIVSICGCKSTEVEPNNTDSTTMEVTNPQLPNMIPWWVK